MKCLPTNKQTNMSHWFAEHIAYVRTYTRARSELNRRPGAPWLYGISRACVCVSGMFLTRFRRGLTGKHIYMIAFLRVPQAVWAA